MIAAASPEVRLWLSSNLKPENYLLLEACTRIEMLHFARCHSRPIQVLLAQEDLIDDAHADLLAHLRPHMQILILRDEGGLRGLPLGRVRDEVRQLMQPIQQLAGSR